MAASNLVIVESPAKAKTINKYLGNDYEVIASYGHIRDLPPKDGSVRPDENFAMDWAASDRSLKHISEISKKAKAAKAVYLATDPDREGEAISWHIKEILKDKKLLDKLQLYRVTFNEITKNAVSKAFEDNIRDLDINLIDAYLARRALDYLVGFNLSPVLWRKLPGSKSAGRVQSVALRLICERETEIEKFRADEYWSIEAKLQTPDGAPFKARLTHLAGNKLDKLDIGSEKDAIAAVERIRSKNLSIQKIEKKQQRRNPAPPFITSTMQQEAARKLGFSASQTMRTAQKLYEGIDIGGETVGLITYMRTDGTTLSMDAVNQARNVITREYGDKYLPNSPRLFKSKAKNAQEAHEAIRPTDLSRRPADMRRALDDQMFKLYDLIWKRTMASQMESAVMDKVAVDISDGTDDVVLRANGSVVTFDGFLTLYFETSDDDEDDDTNNPLGDRRLPPMNEGANTNIQDVMKDQHFTQPPPRFTEASLVKKMEELGIGRPSTYASIIQVLQDRDYVNLEKRRFEPQDRGRIVTTFLIKFFPKLMDYSFTASLEDELDAISAGNADWRESLSDFWVDFSKVVEETKGLTITQVIDYLNDELGAHFFPDREDGTDGRKCTQCDGGQLSLKLGKFGAFVGCSNYPECKFTRPLVVPDKDDEAGQAAAEMSNEPVVLGKHPDNGREISLRKGPYGPYVQMEAEDPEDKKSKPKRQGLPRGTNPKDVDLDAALSLLALPREVGTHPETGKKIEAGIGRFGPFLKHDGSFTSLPKSEDVLTVGMNRAVDVIAAAAEKKAAKEAAKAAKEKAGGKKTTKKKTTKKKKASKKKAPAKAAKKS